MTSWISQQIERYYTDYTSFKKSQEFTPHRFDLFCCVEENDEEYAPFECVICQETIEIQSKSIQLGCKHKFCNTCIDLQLDTASKVREFKEPTCALCRAPIKDLYFKNYDVGVSIYEKYIMKDRILMNLIDEFN
jgi:hypothetical protein